MFFCKNRSANNERIVWLKTGYFYYRWEEPGHSCVSWVTLDGKTLQYYIDRWTGLATNLRQHLVKWKLLLTSHVIFVIECKFCTNSRLAKLWTYVMEETWCYLMYLYMWWLRNQDISFIDIREIKAVGSLVRLSHLYV